MPFRQNNVNSHQSPVLLAWRTVRKNIELPLEIMDYDPKKLPARSQEMLDLVGLSKFADHYPKQLSAVIDVDIDRPRRLEDRDTMHFAELVSKVRNSFEGGSL